MPRPTFHDLIVATGGQPMGAVMPGEPTGRVRTDSRLVTAGDLFWALPGATLDGHDFVLQALQRGAAGCVIEADRPEFADVPRLIVRDALRALADFANWNRRSHEAMVIGVTGSVGKTTTRSMLHTVLSARFRGCQSPGNFNNHVGLPLSLLEIADEHEFAVLEFGASHEGEIARLAEIARPEAAIVTAVAPAHLEKFGSLEAIVRAKGELVEAIPAEGFVVLNGDDPAVRSMARRTGGRAILVGERPDNDLVPSNITIANDQVEITVNGRSFRLQAIGRHHVLSMLCCIAVAREIGLSDHEIAQGFEQFSAVPGRCRRLGIGLWTVIDDTYNASPASMAAACRVLSEWTGSPRRWLAVGDMLELGPMAGAFHRAVGRYAAELNVDGIAAFGDFADDIVAGAREAGLSGGQLAVCSDISTLMLQLTCWLSPGDVLLVKGSRGMRMERVLEELKLFAGLEERSATRIAA